MLYDPGAKAPEFQRNMMECVNDYECYCYFVTGSADVGQQKTRKHLQQRNHAKEKLKHKILTCAPVGTSAVPAAVDR